MKTREQEELSAAEKALLKKYRVLRERRAWQNRSGGLPKSTDVHDDEDKDEKHQRRNDRDAARKEAIRIIKANKQAEKDAQGQTEGVKKTKIKLSFGGNKAAQDTGPSKSSDSAITKPATMHTMRDRSPEKKSTAVSVTDGERNKDVGEMKDMRKKAPKRPLKKHAQTLDKDEHQAGIPSTPTLFVANLPGYYTQENLFHFFSEFGNPPLQVVDAQMNEGYCSGLVTFSSYDDAQAVLDFQLHESLTVESRPIVVTWAKPSDFTVGGGNQSGKQDRSIDPHSFHPRLQDAKEAAVRVATQITEHNLADMEEQVDPRDARRNVVSYDDL